MPLEQGITNKIGYVKCFKFLEIQWQKILSMLNKVEFIPSTKYLTKKPICMTLRIRFEHFCTYVENNFYIFKCLVKYTIKYINFRKVLGSTFLN